MDIMKKELAEMCRQHFGYYDVVNECAEEVEYGMIIDFLLDQVKASSRFVELPCYIGADVWWINDETNTVECHENGVYGILVKSDGVFVMDESGCLDKVGTKWCYLSKEAAEKALAERGKENEIDT